jgi:hypothetical protein
MRRVWIIAGVCLLALAGACWTKADDFVEDVYFWQDTRTQNAAEAVVPSYNRHVKEIIFIEDSVSLQHPDTVRAIIREAP